MIRCLSIAVEGFKQVGLLVRFLPKIANSATVFISLTCNCIWMMVMWEENEWFWMKLVGSTDKRKLKEGKDRVFLRCDIYDTDRQTLQNVLLFMC